MIDLTKNHVIHGDALKVLVEQIPDNSIDMVFTSPSPPFRYTTENQKEGDRNYNKIGSEADINNYMRNLQKIFLVLYDKVKDTGSLFVNIGDTYNPSTRCLNMIPATFLKTMESGTSWQYKSDLIWDRSGERESYQVDTHRYKRDHEFVFHFVKHAGDQHYFNDHDYLYYKESILTYPMGDNQGKIFTAGFPHEVIEHCMLPTTEKNYVVLDPFAQTGSVAEVAIKHERKFIMIEIDKQWYFKLKEKLIHHL